MNSHYYSTTDTDGLITYKNNVAEKCFEPGGIKHVPPSGIILKLPVLLILALLLFTNAGWAQEKDTFTEHYIHTLLDRNWDYKTISSGDNFPSVSLKREHRGEITILLHAEIPPEAIRQHFGWSASELDQRLKELERAELIRRDSTRGYVPTLMIMPVGDVTRYMPVYNSLIKQSASLIVRHLPKIKEQYKNMSGFKHIPFEHSSLLILSDVLLDNWQINFVEERFLQAKRPLRDGSRYYYSIREDIPWDSTESFGIYGNQYRGYGPYTVGIYGNRRTHNPLNYISLDTLALNQFFSSVQGSARAFKQNALTHLVKSVRDSSYTVPAPFQEGFEALNWMKKGQVQIPVLDKSDWGALDEMALLVTEDLIELLKKYRPHLVKAYESSPYGNEVTFEEYFMWWYHLYYTEVTDLLIAQGHILSPDSGITSYVYAPTQE